MSSMSPSIIQKRLKYFVEFIAPEREEDPQIKAFFEEIRDVVSMLALADGYKVTTVQYAGSYAKHTGLRRYMTGGSEVEGQDIDIAFILENQDATGNAIQRSPIPDFKRYLKQRWNEHLVDHTKSSATLRILKHKLSFDIVPIIKTPHSSIQRLIRIDREERTTSIQGHIEFVRALNRRGKYIHFNNGLRLVKWWRYHQQISSHVFRNDSGQDKVPSFLLDLLCAKAYLQTAVKNNYAEMLYQWFSYLADVTRNRRPIYFENGGTDERTSHWQVIDPMDATNNLVAKWPAYKMDELATWFQQARDYMAVAIHYDLNNQHDQSLNALKKLFGPSIKTQCI